MLPLALFLVSFAVVWAAYHLVLPATWSGARRTLTVLARALLRRQRFASWYERRAPRLRSLHPYRPLVAIGAAGFVAAAVVGVVFLQLAELVQERSEQLERFDYAAWAIAREMRTPAATRFFTAWTLIGTPVGLGLLIFPVAGFLFARGRRWLPVFLVATPLGGWAINSLLKLVFARARPDLALALSTSSSYSFPSGHAMMSMAAFGALAYVVVRLSSRRWVRSAALALASCAAAAVALSRVYLGVHWVSDIVAGAAAGLVWLSTTVAVYELRRRVRVMRAAVQLLERKKTATSLSSRTS